MRIFSNILIIVLFLLSGNLFSANRFTIKNGSWSDPTVWSATSGGSTCNCTPNPGIDNITINHNVTYNSNFIGGVAIGGILNITAGNTLSGPTNDMDIKTGGQLIVCGTLVVRDLQFFNNSVVNVCPTGTVTVNGNFKNNNNSNTVTFNGAVTVAGSFENGNGGAISGTGTVSVSSGPIYNTGNLFGCSGYNPCGGAFPCNVTSPCGAPLPISLLFFEGRPINEIIELSWVTASELNNSRFIVEKSIDGESFQEISRVLGNGTTSQSSYYKSIDSKPHIGINYYRLKQIDNDESFSYSTIIAVKIKTKNADFFPNPWRNGDLSVLNTDFSDSPIRIILKDKLGRNISEFITLSKNGILIIPESVLSMLSSGPYLIELSQKEYIHQSKFIIVK